jgi:hypothetical protein
MSHLLIADLPATPNDEPCAASGASPPTGESTIPGYQPHPHNDGPVGVLTLELSETACLIWNSVNSAEEGVLGEEFKRPVGIHAWSVGNIEVAACQWGCLMRARRRR